jgi:hypothetical protein
MLEDGREQDEVGDLAAVRGVVDDARVSTVSFHMLATDEPRA